MAITKREKSPILERKGWLLNKLAILPIRPSASGFSATLLSTIGSTMLSRFNYRDGGDGGRVEKKKMLWLIMSAIRGGDNDERGGNKVLKIDPMLRHTRVIIRDRIKSSPINRSIDRSKRNLVFRSNWTMLLLDQEIEIDNRSWSAASSL